MNSNYSFFIVSTSLPPGNSTKMILKEITHVHIPTEFSDTTISFLICNYTFRIINTDLNAHKYLHILATNTLKAKIKS